MNLLNIDEEEIINGQHWMHLNLGKNTNTTKDRAIVSNRVFSTLDSLLYPKQYEWRIKSIVSVGRYFMGKEASDVWMIIEVEPVTKKPFTKKAKTAFYGEMKNIKVQRT